MSKNMSSNKPFYSRMNGTVLEVNIDGLDLKDSKQMAKIDKQVEARVKEIVEDLKSSHSKFEDPHFGPMEGDDLGANSLYGTKMPAPAGSKYPRPEDLKWDRPLYDDNHFDEVAKNQDEEASVDEEEVDEYGDDEFGDDEFGMSSIQLGDENDVWCKHGSLFIDGTSSGDVIQGNLGDCWFLGALAVMGANEKLLQDCFWRLDSFKNYGLFVVRFFKDCSLIYVIVDDRIPVKNKDGKIIFASCKDPNELWVPLVEKAYAKLHGCYKALIGGYSHHALSDMTGYCPKLITLKPGFPGYSESLDKEEVWKLLQRYRSWNCLMGTSIQSNPKQNQKVEAEAGMGLHMGHAYSFMDIGEIEDKNAGGKMRLVKLRNPWGKGEWEGSYGDRSEERERAEINEEITKYFKVDHEDIEVNFMDGSFFMPFDAWLERFTSLFVAINFPESWTGKRTQGFWSGESGGNREMGSWISNPKIRMKIDGEKADYKHVFVGLYTRDSRLNLGVDYFKDPVYSTPLAFDIVTAEDFEKSSKDRVFIPFSSKHKPGPGEEAQLVKQSPYNFGNTQIECYLQAGVDYYIVPFLHKRTQSGNYFVTVYTEDDFELEGGAKLSGEQDLMVVGKKTGDAVDKAHTDGSETDAHWKTNLPVAPVPAKDEKDSKKKALSISKAQFYEKAEQLRDRFVQEAQRLSVSLGGIKSLFSGDIDKNGKTVDLSYSEFKRRLMNAGFSLTDLPDEDLVVLDLDNSGTISPEEFVEFFKLGLSFQEAENMPTPPPPPVDDLLFKAADLEGILNCKVHVGRAIREASSWFAKSELEEAEFDASPGSSEKSKNFLKARSVVQYNSETAKKTRYAYTLDSVSGEKIKNDTKQVTLANTSGSLMTPKSAGKAPISGMKGGDASSVRSHAGTTMTISRLTEKAGEESGIKLHSDPELVEAEKRRAGFLHSLRKEIKADNSHATMELEKAGALRKRERTMSKIDKRDIKTDLNALLYLNKNPSKVLDIVLSQNNRDKFGVPVVPEESEKTYEESGIEDFSGVSDVWDDIIDRVITISGSRIGARGSESSLQQALNNIKKMRGRPSSEHFNPFLKSPPPSGIPTPRSSKSSFLKKASKGTTPTPKNLKKYPGTASVTSAQSKSNMASVHDTVNLAGAKLKLDAKDSYYEVYRRLVQMPAISSNEREGDRERHSNTTAISGSYLAAFAKRLFRKFDKNLNGSISLDEFKQALIEMNINLSNEDSATLFNRFETREKDGNIDWDEFNNFFLRHIVSDVITDWDAPQEESSYRPLEVILNEIRNVISPVIIQMTDKQYLTIDEYLIKSQFTENIKKERVENFVLPHNAIFHHMNSSHAQRNVSILRQLGANVNVEDMKRVNRVFSRTVSDFMHFASSSSSKSLSEVVSEAHKKVISGFEARVGTAMDNLNGGPIDSQRITKIWNVICTNKNFMKFDEMVEVIKGTILENTGQHSKPSNNDKDEKEEKDGSKEEIAINSEGAGSTNSDSLGVDGDDRTKQTFRRQPADLVSRLTVDHIVMSAWNKSQQVSTDQAEMHSISYSAFEAYIRRGHINAVENKLKYLLQLEMSIAGPTVWTLVHMYMNHDKNHAVVIVHEPLSGEVLHYEFKDDFSKLPNPDDLIGSFEANKGMTQLRDWGLANPYNYLYNPVDTPVEDQTIANIVSRLRIVRTVSEKTPNSLMLAEDPRFVRQLNHLLDAASNLPFFCTCNDSSLYFETDENSLNTNRTGLRSLVFGSIRKHKQLHTFLTTVMSDLNVILTSYNAGIRITMSWREMLAHLTEYRNPFVTVELKPRFLEPNEYIYIPKEDRSAFDGSDENDDLAVQKSTVMTDGGTHPSFDAEFNIKFRPPKLTSCKLLSTEIHKMSVGGIEKYIILMVREAKKIAGVEENSGTREKIGPDNESFRFITIYDSRSATDYQCGVEPDCDLYKALVEQSPTHVSANLETFMQYVADAADSDKIILGPAITPRLILTVFNQRGRNEEVLGQSQMSISAVLSGSGVGKSQWSTLTHMVDNGNGKDMQVSAGELQVELGFRKTSEILDELKAEKSRLDRKAKKRIAPAKNNQLQSDSSNTNVSQAVTAEEDKGLSKKEKAAQKKQQKYIKELEANLNAAKEGMVPIQEFEKLKNDYVKALEQLKYSTEKGNKSLNEHESASKNHTASIEDDSKLLEMEENMNKMAEDLASKDAAIEQLQNQYIKESVEGYGSQDTGKDPDVLKQLQSQLRQSKEALQAAKQAEEAAKKEVLSVQAARTSASAVDEDMLRELEELRQLKKQFEEREAQSTMPPIPAEINKMERSTSVSPGGTSSETKSASASTDKTQAQTKKKAQKKLNPTPPSQARKGKEAMSVAGTGYSGSGGKLPSPSGSPARKVKAEASSSFGSSLGSQDVTLPAVTSSALVDWNTYELPDGWDRKLDVKSGMVYYVDHANKITQWKHPLYKKHS